MRQQVYGGREADEFRSQKDAWEGRLQDNQIAEGGEVATLRRMASERDWDAFQKFSEKLRLLGHSQGRVDSMVARSTAGLKF